jgi:hypothetical protein
MPCEHNVNRSTQIERVGTGELFISVSTAIPAHTGYVCVISTSGTKPATAPSHTAAGASYGNSENTSTASLSLSASMSVWANSRGIFVGSVAGEAYDAPECEPN